MIKSTVLKVSVAILLVPVGDLVDPVRLALVVLLHPPSNEIADECTADRLRRGLLLYQLVATGVLVLGAGGLLLHDLGGMGPDGTCGLCNGNVGNLDISGVATVLLWRLSGSLAARRALVVHDHLSFEGLVDGMRLTAPAHGVLTSLVALGVASYVLWVCHVVLSFLDDGFPAVCWVRPAGGICDPLAVDCAGQGSLMLKPDLLSPCVSVDALAQPAERAAHVERLVVVKHALGVRLARRTQVVLVPTVAAASLVLWQQSAPHTLILNLLHEVVVLRLV